MSRRRLSAFVAAVVLACAAFGTTAAADGGHLPGFSIADKRVAISNLPEALRFTFGGVPGAKGFGVSHGKGPVWLGEVKRPGGTVYVAGNGRWVCESEVRLKESGGGSSCTTPAGARDFGLLDVRSCGKGPPRHFRVVGLVPDGIEAVYLERPGGIPGRTLPVIGNTIAFTVGRQDIVLHGVGEPEAEELERTLPLARAAAQSGGDERGGCSFYTFFETKAPGRPPLQPGGSRASLQPWQR